MSRTFRSLMLVAVLLALRGSASASSQATIEVKGSEQPGDASSITVSFADSNGQMYSETITYGQFSTQASVASTIGGMFANTYVPGGYLSAQVFCGTTNIVLFTLRSPATFGNLTVTGSTASFQLASSGFASSGSRTTPAITWPAPAPITAGTALSGTQLNATANAAGAFTYFPGPGTVLDAGNQTLSATFTPTDITDYAPATATVTLVVNSDQSGQNTPVISWGTPAVISYGTALSSTQLNASASYNGTSVPGMFEYTPAAGEVLDAGSQTLLVNFFPTDSVHYSTAGGSVVLVVNASSTQPLNIYNYSIANQSGGSGYASNSNLLNYTDSVTGTWSFTYDSLNRLVAGTPTPASGNILCWSYDPFGNRTAQSAQSAACPTLPSVPTATASYYTSNQVAWTSVNGASSGFSYDAAGNVLNDNANTYIYDGEGRICAVKSEPISGIYTMTQYIYDAEGARVAKGSITNWAAGCNTAQNGFAPTNSYVLGPSNEQLTETDGNGNWIHSNVYAAGMLIATYDTAPSGDPALHFQLEDWLGSRRVQTDTSGNPEETFSNLPFGDDMVSAPTPGAPPTADDATEHHFTGKERDSESGLDYFTARYYGSNMGRFMSPDDFGGHLEDPQTLNKYAYAGNNPLRYTDPSGHDFWQSCQQQSSTCGNQVIGKGTDGKDINQLVSGTTDSNGKFTSTVITSASLGQSGSGNTANVDGTGVHITTGTGTDSQQSGQGIFIAGTASADIKGTGGGWDQFNFHIDGNDVAHGGLTTGTATYLGQGGHQGMMNTLNGMMSGDNGPFQYPGEDHYNGFHPGAHNVRFSPGDYPDIMNYGPSPHFPVPAAGTSVPNFHIDSGTGPLHVICAKTGYGCY